MHCEKHTFDGSWHGKGSYFPPFFIMSLLLKSYEFLPLFCFDDLSLRSGVTNVRHPLEARMVEEKLWIQLS